MSKYGFYFDAESCIGCHTCQVACKDTHDLPVGVNYRSVRSFCSGEGYEPHLYHISLSQQGCDMCADLRAVGEPVACQAACPMRCIEFGELEELESRHSGENLSDFVAPVNASDVVVPTAMRVRDYMMDPDFDEIIV